MIDTFSLAQLLTDTATVKRQPPAVGGRTGVAVEIGTIGQVLIVPAAQFGRVFGATPPLSGGKASYIALMVLESVVIELDPPHNAIKSGDTMASDGVNYVVIGKPAPWHGTLLAVDLTTVAA